MDIRKTMPVRIGDEREFDAAIEQHAVVSARIAALSAIAKNYKSALEAYAFGGSAIPEHLEKAGFKGSAIIKGIGEVQWAFERGTASIRLAPGVELPYTIEKLLATKKTAECVYRDYDSDKLRALYGNNPAALEKFGLTLAEPTPKYKIALPKAKAPKEVA